MEVAKTNPPPNELINAIDNLRNRVDAIDTDIHNDKKKPWYKKFSDRVALIAFVLSIGSFIYSYNKDRSADLESKLKEVRDNMGSILLLEKEANKEADSLHIPVSIYVNDRIQLRDKFELLLKNVDDICKKLPDKFPSDTYNHIGYCYYNYSLRLYKAFEYYNYAVKAADDAYDSALVYSALASTYYDHGVFFDIGKARDYIEKDVNKLKSISKDQGNFLVSREYAYASFFEAGEDPTMFKRFIDSAIAYCNYYKKNPSLYAGLRNYINQQITYANTNYNLNVDTLRNL